MLLMIDFYLMQCHQNRFSLVNTQKSAVSSERTRALSSCALPNIVKKISIFKISQKLQIGSQICSLNKIVIVELYLAVVKKGGQNKPLCCTILKIDNK